LIEEIMTGDLELLSCARARGMVREYEHEVAKRMSGEYDLIGRTSAIAESDRNLSEHDPPWEALGDRRLADPWFPNQDRVVLRPAGENLDDSHDLPLSPDHRVKLVLERKFGQVAAEAGKVSGARERAPGALQRCAIRVRIGETQALADRLDRLFDRLAVQAKPAKPCPDRVVAPPRARRAGAPS
jgi:hypothetical protein